MRQRHFVEADVKADGACHKEVVVRALFGTEGAVRFFFVVEVFVDAAFVAFDIKAFADYFDES